MENQYEKTIRKIKSRLRKIKKSTDDFDMIDRSFLKSALRKLSDGERLSDNEWELVDDL